MEKRKQYKIFFSEEQRLSDSPKKWIFPVIFLLSVGTLGYGLIQQLVLGKPWGDNPMSNTVLMLTFVFVVALMIVIWVILHYIKLMVSIDKEGIHYRFPIFIRREKLIPKEQIVSYDVRKYRPLFEYSGLGYRTKFIYINDPQILREILPGSVVGQSLHSGQIPATVCRCTLCCPWQ